MKCVVLCWVLILHLSFLTANNSTSCFEFDRDFECTSVVNYLVPFTSSQQQMIFESLALAISDVRMYPPDCRRALLVCLFCCVGFTLIPAAQSTCISLTHTETWEWWRDVLFARKYIPISERMNPLLSATARVRTPTVEDLKFGNQAFLTRPLTCSMVG
jgi:hypothetical protein